MGPISGWKGLGWFLLLILFRNGASIFQLNEKLCLQKCPVSLKDLEVSTRKNQHQQFNDCLSERFLHVPPLPITSKKSKSKILTERTKSIHVINVFHGGEPQSLATSIIYFAIMICLCVNPQISSAKPGMPTTSLWGTYLYLQSRTGCTHTQAGPAQEREPPGFAEAKLSKAWLNGTI